MIDKLEFFIALAKTEHFGRAAEECGVTQPTLSAAIRQLEDMLGVVLVQRGSRFQGLTPEGQRVLEWARRIVGDSRTMREEMRTTRQGLSGHLKIAVIPTALAMVARLTTPFRDKHPNVTFSVLSRTSLEVLAMLADFEIDVGITYLDNEPLGRVAMVPLYEERYQLITSAGKPLSDRKSRDMGRGGAPAALPADARHAESPHHQPASCGGGIGGDAIAGIEFDDPADLAHPHRKMGLGHASQPCRDAWRGRADPRHPDRRTGRKPSGRPRRRPSRTTHATRFRLPQSGANRLPGVAESIEIPYRSTDMIY